MYALFSIMFPILTPKVPKHRQIDHTIEKLSWYTFPLKQNL